MHYRKNFLTDVIFRLDFPEISDLKSENDIQFTTDIADKYPEYTKQQLPIASIALTPTSDSYQKEIIWRREHLSDRNGNKAVYLLPQALIIQYKDNQYKNFQEFFKDIEDIYCKFQTSYKLPSYSRIGLRYINVISMPVMGISDWNNYIRLELASAINPNKDENTKLIRSMHQIHFMHDEISTLFNYGIFNKDYPNTITNSEFILDYDCFEVGVITEDDVLNQLKKLNKIASVLFNGDITETLKQKMEVTND